MKLKLPKLTLPKLTLPNVATAVIAISTFTLLWVQLPFTQNFADESKLLLLMVTAIVLGVLFAIAIIRRGAIELVMSKLTFAVAAFLIAVTASTFFTSPYPVKGILGFGGVFIAASLIVLFAAPLLHKVSKYVWFGAYSVGMIVVIIGSLLELAGVGPSRLLPLFGPFAAPTLPIIFNLSGSILTGLQLAILGVVGMVAVWLSTKKATPFQVVAMVILLVGVLVYGYFMLPGKSPYQLPSLAASWSIALDSVRDPRGALIGAGTGAYTAVYQQYKPYWMNETEQWATVFANGSNMPLTLLTITGFLGLFTWLSMAIVSIIEVRDASKEELPISAMLITTFVIQLVLPPNYIVIGIQAFLLALFIAGKRQQQGVLHFSFFHAQLHHAKQVITHKPAANKIPIYLTSALVLAVVVALSFYTLQFYRAAQYSLQAIAAVGQNDALSAYNYQQKAIALNPYLDQYRREYAATSLAMAEMLANKTDKTTEDDTTVGQLIQQAVREAQAADALDPKDAQNAILAAQIYQRLVGGVEGADTFSEQYFVKAINLYPTAPELYIGLAGLYFQRKQWDTAVGILRQGLNSKSDYPNLLFNLAYGYEQLKLYADAKSLYEATRTFVLDSTSQEYIDLSKKIEELSALVEEMKAAEAQNAENPDEQGATETTNSTQAPSAVELNLNQQTDEEAVRINQRSFNEETPLSNAITGSGSGELAPGLPTLATGEATPITPPAP